MATDQKRFGKNLRKAREAAGLSQEGLADASGLHWSGVSRLERGEQEPRLGTILRLARALKIKPGKLLDGLD